MVEIVCNLYEMEGISKVTLSQIMWCHFSWAQADVRYNGPKSAAIAPLSHQRCTFPGHCGEECEDGVQPTWYRQRWRAQRRWVCQRLLEGLFRPNRMEAVNELFPEKNCLNLTIDFRTQHCRTFSMVPQSDTKAQYEWVEEFVFTSGTCLWQTYLQMIPRMILRLWYKWLEALKWSYDSLAQYFPSDSYALKLSCVICVKWCPIALAEIFK